jgi:hypothetical protein
VSSPSFMNTPIPPDGAAALDAATIAVVLYLSPLTRKEWVLAGPEEMARFVLKTVADPRCRIPEMTALVAAAECAGTLGAPEQLASARRFAPHVLRQLSN